MGYNSVAFHRALGKEDNKRNIENKGISYGNGEMARLPLAELLRSEGLHECCEGGKRLSDEMGTMRSLSTSDGPLVQKWATPQPERGRCALLAEALWSSVQSEDWFVDPDSLWSDLCLV